jgi:hypothetical protein
MRHRPKTWVRLFFSRPFLDDRRSPLRENPLSEEGRTSGAVALAGGRPERAISRFELPFDHRREFLFADDADADTFSVNTLALE